MKKLLFTFLILSTFAHAQEEELLQRKASFLETIADRFEVIGLNATEPNYGALDKDEAAFHDYIKIKQQEKELNTLGNNVRPKYDLSLFYYESEAELKLALKYWFKDFMNLERITPGREIRTVANAEPTIMIVDAQHIAILTLSCYSVDQFEFRDWRETMLESFGSPTAMVIELDCEGPLQWTKNAPDPKDKSWR